VKALLVRKEFSREDLGIIRDFVKYLIEYNATIEDFDKMSKEAFTKALEVLVQKAEDRLKELKELLEIFKNV
jgi:predicted amino acid-binding ACT domain protein